ncbi:hypothetical protein JR316_0001562 [Psilocybe cubensis]|uniref:Uncharacterized protein n=1 Tax=Psilocybe cubensis TaxID=181762 RepID=A0ACB8HA20_PSICU|nr:hypothetical protein JR316_0001562 [Psilocybe cubensis]KAH9484663.1 hypothetical protein JR316_0001562 [Psilocybe cubensis]
MVRTHARTCTSLSHFRTSLSQSRTSLSHSRTSHCPHFPHCTSLALPSLPLQEGGGIECARASPFSSSSTYARGAFLIVFWVFVSCVLGVLGVFVGLAISVYSWLVSGVVWISSSSVARWLSTVDLDSLAAALPDARVHAWATQALRHLNKGKGKDGAGNPNINVQTAVGVVLLSVAAAAVFWKIKPE